MENTIKTAILGGGCFWCTEAIFEDLKGVISVIPGYAGGDMNNPTYKDICNGGTGHAEVIKIAFDPCQITYKTLLEVFFATHDPTTLNRQGNDTGTQYRSIILYTAPEQKDGAERFIAELDKEGEKVVTELKPFEAFYEAEKYHHNYYQKNPEKTYCQIVINPKLEKVQEEFDKLLKK